MSLRERWWFTPVGPAWGLRDKAVPKVRIFPGGDEHCNDTLMIRIPFLGDLVIRFRRRIRLQGVCDRCVEEMGPYCNGCQGCHDGPRCHEWLYCQHESTIKECPLCGGLLCGECEPNACPRENNVSEVVSIERCQKCHEVKRHDPGKHESPCRTCHEGHAECQHPRAA